MQASRGDDVLTVQLPETGDAAVNPAHGFNKTRTVRPRAPPSPDRRAGKARPDSAGTAAAAFFREAVDPRKDIEVWVNAGGAGGEGNK